MANEWRDTTLGDVLTLQRGFDLPETEREQGPFPVVASTGQVGTHGAAMVRGPGVVIGRSGSLGGGQFIRSDFWPLNTTLWVKDFKGNDVRFCYYLLKSLDLATFNAGSGVPTLNRNHIHPMPVRAPAKVQEQRAIAHILGTLDDKIELNRRMNETLEAMTRALFNSWFVGFEPVRAKAEGRDPGLPEKIADLFPDSFEDSELGEIPKGWRTSSVYDLATYINGAAYRAFEPNEERRGLPIIKIAELKAGVTDQTRFSAVDMPHKYRIDTGDILFSWSGNPDTSIDIFVWTHGSAWLNQHIFRVVPSSLRARAFVLMTLRNLRPVFAEVARNKQTTGLGHVTVEDLKRLLVVRPPESVLLGWNTLIESVLSRSFGLEGEGNTLAALRDALLPKLISGELRV